VRADEGVYGGAHLLAAGLQPVCADHAGRADLCGLRGGDQRLSVGTAFPLTLSLSPAEGEEGAWAKDAIESAIEGDGCSLTALFLSCRR